LAVKDQLRGQGKNLPSGGETEERKKKKAEARNHTEKGEGMEETPPLAKSTLLAHSEKEGTEKKGMPEKKITRGGLPVHDSEVATRKTREIPL